MFADSGIFKSLGVVPAFLGFEAPGVTTMSEIQEPATGAIFPSTLRPWCALLMIEQTDLSAHYVH